MDFFLDREGYPRTGRIVVTAIAVLVGLPLLIWGASVVLAPVFGAGNAYKQTETADYRIENYEHFKDACNAIVAADGKIELAQDALDREQVGPLDSLREQQLATNIQALTNTRVELVTQYNSDVSKNKTKAKFKDAGLPDYIDPTGQIGAVTCPSE